MEILGPVIAAIIAAIIGLWKYFSKKKPKLELYTEVKHDGTTGSKETGFYRCMIIYGIVNSGSAIAKHLQLSLRAEPYGLDVRWGLTGNGGNGLPRIPTVGSYEKFSADADQVIYPNDRLAVTATRFTIPAISPKIENAVIEYVISAEGAKTLKGVQTITVEEIIDKVIPKTA